MKRFLTVLALALLLTVPAFAADDQTTGAWFKDHWLWVGSVLYAALSEIIGASPLKNNTVIGIVMWVLKRIIGKQDRPA